MEETFPDFMGKSVAFYITTTATVPDWLTDGVVLESPTFQMQANRLFVVGQTPKEDDETYEGNWASDRQAGLAWDSVFYYVVLPSEEYQELRKNIADEE